MHSRIFQIEDKPVTEEDRLCQDSLPDWFTNSIADYTSDISREAQVEEIEWLMGTNFGKVCVRDGDKITFNIDVGAYFDERFKEFKLAVEDLSKVDIHQFISGHSTASTKSLDMMMFSLKAAVDDDYGFYVWQDYELYTMDSWMRRVKPLGVYYLGGVVDYHF